MWLTCDIRDTYFVQGSKLVSTMLILHHSCNYDHCCICQWVLPDTPGAWPAWRWWWESSWPVWWWSSPPHSLNAHTPDPERTKGWWIIVVMYCCVIQLAQVTRQHGFSTEAVCTLVWLILFLASISSSYIICWWFNRGTVFRPLVSILISVCCLARFINNRKHLQFY